MKVLRVLSIIAAGLAFGVMTTASAAAQTNGSSDLLTTKQVKALAATAKTPADDMELSKHFAALATNYDAETVEHDAVAKASRGMPSAAESKRLVAPDTAVHLRSAGGACPRRGERSSNAGAQFGRARIVESVFS
jgi:hypothetical protein